MSRLDEEIAAKDLALDEARVELLRTALTDGGDLLAHRDTILGLIGELYRRDGAFASASSSLENQLDELGEESDEEET